MNWKSTGNNYKWALNFDFRKSKEIVPRDFSTDDILKVVDIYPKIKFGIDRTVFYYLGGFSIFKVKGNFEWAM